MKDAATDGAAMNEAAVRIVRADLDDPAEQAEIVELLDHYARHPGGGGRALDPGVIARIGPGLARFPGSRVFLARDIAGRAVGVAVCFPGYSTFQAAPLLNVHDLAVHESARGRGIGRALLAAVKEDAAALGCCRVTLEVYGDNSTARRLYERAGFRPTQEFWRCELR